MNNKNLQYILTPDGFSFLAMRSYHFIVSTIRRYKKIRALVQQQIVALAAKGYTDFILMDDGDVADIVEVVCRESLSDAYTVRRNTVDFHEKSVVLKLYDREMPSAMQGKVPEFYLEVAP